MVSMKPSDLDLERELRNILHNANVDELSMKTVRRQMEEKFQVDLLDRKDFLKDKVTSIMAEDEDEDEDEGDEEESVGEGDEDGEDAERPHATGTKRSKPSVVKKRATPKMQLSKELYEFLGSSDMFMSRGDVTKALWAYIKANNLQDPKDGRIIRNDEAMTRVFKCKTIKMMQISTKLSQHMKKYSELVGSEDQEHVAPQTAKKAKKAPAKVVGAKKGNKKDTDGKGAKKTRQPSTIKWRVSDELAAVVGTSELTYADINPRIMDYVRAHGLQDPSNKRVINCDPTLERVMGRPTVQVFGMQAHITPHRLHKVS